ncbi:MAG TPA: tetratricopeptide repeat protein [Cyclobacteriaceae bacterium]|jgi:hypothetical protein|nr:tetratricopeptide repeat protein [Cyclobacteriaceae bacterium]
MKKIFAVFLFSHGAVLGQPSATKVPDSLFASQQWKAAIPIYENVVKAGGSTALTWNRLGYCYHNVGQLDLAIKNYLISLQNNPAPFLEQVVQSRLARVYSLKNELEKSFASMDKALVLGYTNMNELENNSDFMNARRDKRFEGKKKQANENAFPCLKDSRAKEFDFWLGNWDVYVRGTNTLAGKSKIESASGGCMVLENWTAIGGVAHNGKSMNFVDPVTGKWIQVWVGSSGIVPQNITRFYDGEYKDGAMRFVFDREVNGSKIIGRFIFYNEGPNQVRQFNEQSSDGGKTWTTSYDFTYKRVEK